MRNSQGRRITLRSSDLPAWFAPGLLHSVVSWLYIEGVNPFSCSSLASLTSVAFTIIVSKVTQPLPESHVEVLFENA